MEDRNGISGDAMGDAEGRTVGVQAGEQGLAGAFASCCHRHLLCFSEDFLKIQMCLLQLGFVGLI